jgi:hypothetical protein
MALVKCSECGAAVSSEAATCIKCGAPCARFVEPKKSAGWNNLAVIFMACVIAFVGLASYLPKAERDPAQEAKAEAKWRLEQTIKLCWEEQARKSLSPATQRFIAGACEQGEEDYRSKYGRYFTKSGKKP